MHFQQTQKTLEQHFNRLAQTYGVANVSKQFAVEPRIEQNLEKSIAETNEFLKKITTLPVKEITGEVVGIGSDAGIAGRTKTSANAERQPSSVLNLSDLKYKLEQTNFDTSISYTQIDAWAGFSNFGALYKAAVLEAIALDRIKIGFYGTSAADNTDNNANPNLEDVNKGWFQFIKENAAAQIMNDGATAGTIKVGTAADADYKNIDQAAADLKSEIIHQRFGNNADLVVLIGSEFFNDRLQGLLGQANSPTEAGAMNTLLPRLTIAGMPAYTPTFFPAKGLVVTSLKNLAIYYQTGARRRQIIDQPNYNRIVDFNSSNEGYVVTQPLKFAALNHDNVVISNA